ncbi:mediator of RNA polymerase II transcription subunit 15 [Biomphalaria pfeifferi]|uniref:Mediator of RNA polymerase II transcription subunit 15 n=1 Tax=Biomphalaria pfeifferi TaxID=112525 RepID=A0AAD8FGL8_BIOPF|nr:mediator of RNA polymerase II transcription subunit 15 [Biomphalaria pfeifferi]
MFAIENTPSLPSTSSSPQEVPVVSSLACDSVFTMEDNFLLPSTSSPQEVPVVSSLACDSVFTMEDNFLLPSTSSPQEVPENTKKPNGKRKSASSSKGKSKKNKEANLGDGENVSSEPQVLCSLTFDSVLNMEDNCVFPSTSSQQVPDNKIKQTAKPKSSKGKARKKKGDNTPEDPYARVKRSKSQKLKGLPLDKAEQLRLKLNEQERNRQRAIREAIGELKQMDIPDFLSVDNYKVGCKCHTLRTVIAYIAHMMNQIENHDQIHGVSEHLQQQTQLHQQRLQEKLNVMQQEEAQYQLQQQELEKEILLHQQESVQQQQLIQQQQFLQPTTNLQIQCDSQQQQLQSDQQQVTLEQPQIQPETQQILPNLQQPQLLFNPQQHQEMNHHQQQSSLQQYQQQPDTIVEQQITIPENQQQIPQQLPSTKHQPLQPQLQQHISSQFHSKQPDVQPQIPVLLHQQQTHQGQSLLPSINPSCFPSYLSAPTTSLTPMNSTSFNHAPESVGSNGQNSSMYQGQYQHWGVNHFQLPVFAPQYYPVPMYWATHGQPLGHVSVGPDVHLMNQGQSSKKKPSRKVRSKKGKTTSPARAAAAESTTASTTSTAPTDPGSHTGVSSTGKTRVLDDQNNIVFADKSCPTFSDTISDFCLPTSDQRASGSTSSDSGYSSRSISRESDIVVDYVNNKDQNSDTEKTDWLLDAASVDQFFENLDKL